MNDLDFLQSLEKVKALIGLLSLGTKEGDKFNRDDWLKKVNLDCLMKTKNIVESELDVCNSMSLLASSRHLFEMSIWVKLVNQNSDYALIYYLEGLNNNIQHYTKYVEQLQVESGFLLDIDEKQSELIVQQRELLLKNSDSMTDKEMSNYVSNSIKNFDTQFSSDNAFSLYFDNAKVQGFKRTSDHIIDNEIPRFQAKVAELELEKDELLSKLSSEQNDLVPSNRKRWRWDLKAAETDMTKEYKFIYSYTSKLLHATPMSISTDQQDLMQQESDMFIRYINYKMNQLVDMFYTP